LVSIEQDKSLKGTQKYLDVSTLNSLKKIFLTENSIINPKKYVYNQKSGPL